MIYYNGAVELTDNKKLKAISYSGIALVYKDKGEIQKAQEYLTKAYKLYDSIGATADAQDVLAGIKELDKTKGARK